MDFSDLVARHDYKHPRLVHDALGYAAIGLRVVPLYDRDKRPRIERWQKRATTDPNRIVAWFERWPESNVGLLMGDGIIALDVDPRNGGKGSLKELLGRRTLPATAHAWTGGGGDHYLFRVDPAFRIGNVTGLRPGLDIKGERGCIVVEPSVHPSTGKEYTWGRPPKHGIAEAPAWLVTLLTARGKEGIASRSSRPAELTRRGDAGRLLADTIDRFPVSGPGRRNETMVRLVCSLLGRGYVADVIVEVVEGWWRHFYDQGTIRTPPSQARTAIGGTIRAIDKSGTLRRAVGIDHRGMCEKISLNPEQITWISEGIVVNSRIMRSHEAEPLTSLHKRVTEGIHLCRNAQERAFVEALVVHLTHKLVNTGESVLKATRDQLRQIINDRHELTLDNTQFNRLKGKYVTRPGKPATRFELVVQTKQGRQGIASEFELTGLRQLLPSEAPEAVLSPFPQSDGCFSRS